MNRWYWLFVVTLCIALIYVDAAGKKKGHRSKSKSSNSTKSHKTTTPEPTTIPTTTLPPPPPPKSCDDEGKCSEKNKKCNPENKCVCDVHFREIYDGSCVPKPQLGESCFNNITWLECDGQGVDSNCYSGEGPNRGKCVCAKGHEPSKADKNCAPITKKLAEDCKHDAECFIAYSSCNKGKCTCIDGFSASDDGVCKPASHSCPSGEAKKGKGGVATCEIDFESGTIGDNCGAGHFCFVPPHTLTNIGKPMGHCCPTPPSPKTANLVCPYGEPLNNATCPDRKSDSEKQVPNTCPQYSHQCFAIPQRPHDMICCPSPCRQSISHFNYNGQCFDYALLGRSCILAAQCTDQAECADNGAGSKVCKCKKGYVQTSANQCEESR